MSAARCELALLADTPDTLRRPRPRFAPLERRAALPLAAPCSAAELANASSPSC